MSIGDTRITNSTGQMKKIMFDDRFGLTQAVLDGRKTMTRRFAEKVLVEDENGFLCWNGEFKNPRYKPGDVVAVAQSYKDVIYTDGLPHPLVAKPGWTNKMYVRADLMPNQIRITSVRIERIQDIGDEDCLREGIVKALGLYGCEGVCERGDQLFFCNPREAFASLITKMAGKKAWDDNPWVFVYEFELIR